ncbi:MAG: hypothetical protein RDU89_04825 [bacterium]|nr:hypothetical protein [bacterium]
MGYLWGYLFTVLVPLVLLNLLALPILAIARRTRRWIRPAAQLLAILVFLAGVSLGLGAEQTASMLHLVALAVTIQSVTGLFGPRREHRKYWAGLLIIAGLFLVWTLVA